MSSKTQEITQAEVVAESLLVQFLDMSEQMKLFEPDPYAQYALKSLERVRADNPDKLVADSNRVDRFRMMASFLGAGFHPSQYEDIMYVKQDPQEVGKLVQGYWGSSWRIKECSLASNRMTDEVLHNELFILHVPTTTYDMGTGSYITTPEDLKKIFKFDYWNLQACRDLNFDLLYERED